jgi:hypothetical protein
MADAAAALVQGDLREFAHAYVQRFPAEFYEAPASSTGRWHPQWANGPCGLVLHSIVVARTAHVLAELYGPLTSPELDCVALGALCHDSHKGIKADGRWSGKARDHADKAAVALRAAGEEAGLTQAQLGRVRSAAAAVASHEARWALTSVPVSDMGRISACVAVADFVASRSLVRAPREASVVP